MVKSLSILMAVFGASVIAVIGWRPIPCDAQGRDNTKLPGLVAGVVPLVIAEANLKWFEAQAGDVFIPEGKYWFSRAPRVKTGQRVYGAGMNRTSIRNAFCYSPFGDNCSLQVLQGHDPGHGYVNGFDRQASDRIRLLEAGAESSYPVGSLVFTWKWNGYADGVTNKTRVRVHRIKAAAGPVLVLDGATDPEANAVVWTTAAARIAPAAEKAASVTATETLHPKFIVGARVKVTGGPTSANEVVGEHRVITAIAKGTVELDRPLRQSYGETATILLYTPVTDVTIADLTIENGPHPDGQTTYFDNCVNLSFERVRSMGDLQATLSSNVSFTDCITKESIALNGTHDAFIDRCQIRHGYMEENCFDVEWRNTRISGPVYGGLTSNFAARSERIRCFNLSIEAARDIPVWLEGRECVLDNVRIQGSRNPVSWVYSYVGGENFVVSNLSSDLPVVFKTGLNANIFGVKSLLYLGWAAEPAPIGSAVSCSNVVFNMTPAQKAQWQTAANATAAATASLPEVKVAKMPVKMERPAPPFLKP